MKVVFRADASVELGTGHVMRCLTLAETLKTRGADICFASVALPGNLIEYVRGQGYYCHILSQRNDLIQDYGEWLVVDHYQLDYEWERLMRAHFDKIFVIDEFANRKHDCDILLDQNRINGNREIYRDCIPEEAMVLLGPQYALLRKEFSQKKEKKKIVLQGQTRKVRVLVSFGGSDPTHETIKLLRTIMARRPENMSFDVIVGSLNEDLHEIEAMLLKDNQDIRLYKHVTNMAEFMRRADIGIGASGTTAWERLCCGLPTLLIIVAENQRDIANIIEKAGAGVVVGEASNVTGEAIWRALFYYINHPQELKRMGAIGERLVDGNGCSRVARYFREE